MSIDAIRKLVEKPACGAVIGGISILLAASFAMSGSCRNAAINPNGPEGGQGKEPAVVTVGKYEVTDSEVERQKASMGMQGPSTPMQDAQMVGYALRSSLDRGYALELANRQGVVLTDDEMIKLLDKQLDDQLMQMKMQAQMSNKLKSGTDAEFDTYLKAQTGKTKAEIKSSEEDALRKKLADPTEKTRAEGDFLVPVLVEKTAATIKPTDDDLKAQYETFNMKKVFVRMGSDEKAAKATIDKAEAAIKSGTPFEKVMALYSMDTPDPGKTVADTISKMNGSSIQMDEGLKPLLKLKPNQISDELKTDSGYAIYKILSIDSTFKQADFDKQKADLAKNYSQQAAQKQVMDAIDKLKKDPAIPIKWESKGYELVYQISQLPEQKLSQADMTKKYDEIAKEAAASTDANPKMLALARYVAFSSVWNTTAPDKRDALVDQRIDSLNQILQTTEGVDLRVELVDAYMLKKKGPEASAALLEAAKVNSDLDQKGQASFNSINATKLSLKEKGLLSAADEKAIDDEQNRWKTERTEKDNAEAEAKKQEDADRKKAEDERKKAEADAKKPVKPVSREDADKAKSGAGAKPGALDLGGIGKK